MIIVQNLLKQIFNFSFGRNYKFTLLQLEVTHIFYQITSHRQTTKLHLFSHIMIVRQSQKSIDKKLNDFLHLPQSLKIYQNQQPKIKSNKNRRFHTESTSESSKKFVCSSSFYDNFQFIDRLTNTKLPYKEALRSCGSPLQLRKNTSRISDRSQLSNLKEIYRKTKLFEMSNLKKRIFKKIEKTNEVSQIKSNNSLGLDDDKKKSPNLTRIMSQKSQLGDFFMYQSHKKNKLRQFIDRTITEINKTELNRIVNEQDFILRDEVSVFNEQRKKIKCDLDKDKIEELIYFRQKQEYQMGKRKNFKQKQDDIMFKQLTNERKDSFDQFQQNKSSNGLQNQKKKKRTFESRFEDQFLQKMIVHTKNYLKREGEYLVTPSRENQKKTLLLKMGKNKLLLNKLKSNISKTQDGANLSGYEFERKDQSLIVSDLKELVEKSRDGDGRDMIREQSGIFADEQRNLMYMLKQGYVSNFSLQLSQSQLGCMARDNKGNNLLHVAVRQNSPDAIEVILKKVPSKICMELLSQKNNTKRTPLEYSLLLVNHQTTEIIQNYMRENNRKVGVY